MPGAPADAAARLASWAYYSAVESLENVKWNLANPDSDWAFDRSLIGRGCKVRSAILAVDPTGVRCDDAGRPIAVNTDALTMAITFSASPDLPVPVDEAYPVAEIDERACILAKAGVMAFWRAPDAVPILSIGRLAGLVAAAITHSTRRGILRPKVPEALIAACTDDVMTALLANGDVRDDPAIVGRIAALVDGALRERSVTPR